MEIKKMLEENVIEGSKNNFINAMMIVKNIKTIFRYAKLIYHKQKCIDCAPNAENLFIKCQCVKYISRLDQEWILADGS